MRCEIDTENHDEEEIVQLSGWRRPKNSRRGAEESTEQWMTNPKQKMGDMSSWSSNDGADGDTSSANQ